VTTLGKKQNIFGISVQRAVMVCYNNHYFRYIFGVGGSIIELGSKTFLIQTVFYCHVFVFEVLSTLAKSGLACKIKIEVHGYSIFLSPKLSVCFGVTLDGIQYNETLI